MNYVYGSSRIDDPVGFYDSILVYTFDPVIMGGQMSFILPKNTCKFG